MKIGGGGSLSCIRDVDTGFLAVLFLLLLYKYIMTLRSQKAS
jgi:hypothetical protein